jgi:hypothetical protein
MNRWLVEHTKGLIILTSILVIVLTGLTVYLLVREIDSREKLGSVESVGPCREHGPNDPECKRQTALIFESCIRHDLHPACTLAKAALRGKGKDIQPREGRFPLGDEGEKEPETRGGGASSGSNPPSQPGPPQGGPPENPPSPSPPAPPKPDLSLDLDSPCPVNALGIEVCTP